VKIPGLKVWPEGMRFNRAVERADSLTGFAFDRLEASALIGYLIASGFGADALELAEAEAGLTSKGGDVERE